MEHILYKEKIDENGEKVRDEYWKPGEKEAYMDIINHAVLLDGLDIFVLKVAVELKI